MFDTVLGKGNVSGGRLGAGTIASVVLHVALLAFAVWFSTRPPPEEATESEITFFAAPPPPPPPAAAPARSEVKKKPTKRPDTVFHSQDPTPPVERPPELPQPVEDAVIGELIDGSPGALIDGQRGEAREGPLGGEVLPFGEGMVRPRLVSGPEQPEYTREALEARVEGVMIVRCTITVQGRVERCRIIKPLPHMEEAVLSTLQRQRYTPVTFQGHAVAVDYTFNFRLVLPRR